MNRSTNESGEDRLVSKDQSDSPSIDNGSCEEGFEGVVLKKGPWTPAEDAILVDYVKKHGEGNWNSVQKHSGLFRCGKSCRLRWANHLRPNLKKGAFTADEERLIIELHAKMGNKWARMAAHLPGRTDNEIKNYWNTRIKRLQRAGLPLYPPDVCLQTVNEIQPSQNTNEFNSMYIQHDLQKKDYESPDVVFGNLNTKRGFLSYAPVLPDISVGNMLTQQLGSSQNSFIPPSMYRPKRLRESENLFPSFNSIGGKKHKSFGLPFPYDPDPFGARHGSHAFLNGNTISASKPIHGAVKLELPSFQYPETDCGMWGMSSPLSPLLDTDDSFFQSPPPTQLVQSDCLSSCTSGLLGEMFHDSKTFNREKNLSCDPSMNSSVVTSSNVLDGSTLNMGETEWGEFSDPISPLGHSVASVFRECTSINGSNIKNPEPVELVATPVGRDAESLNQFDFSSPDTSLGAGWFDQSYECAKDHSFMNDAIASLLGEDLCSDYNNIHDGMSTMNQGSGPGFIPWNNFAAFCQMPDLH